MKELEAPSSPQQAWVLPQPTGGLPETQWKLPGPEPDSRRFQENWEGTWKPPVYPGISLSNLTPSHRPGSSFEGQGGDLLGLCGSFLGVWEDPPGNDPPFRQGIPLSKVHPN